MNGRLQDADYWHARAEKTRVKDEQSSQDDAKQRLLSVAKGYERLAHIAEQQERAGHKSKE